MFCPDCGSILVTRDFFGKTALTCKCGYMDTKPSLSTKETIKKKESVGEGAEEVHPLATYDHVCSKCGFDKAQLISKGIWYTDEDEVQEYVCGRCGNHDRLEGHKVK